MNDQEIIAALEDAHRSASEAWSLLEERWQRCRASGDTAETNRTEAILFYVTKCPWALREALEKFNVIPERGKILSPRSSSDATDTSPDTVAMPGRDKSPWDQPMDLGPTDRI